MRSKCSQNTTSKSISLSKSQANHLEFEGFNSELKKKLYMKYFISSLHSLKVTLYSYSLHLPPPHWAVWFVLFVCLGFFYFLSHSNLAGVGWKP